MPLQDVVEPVVDASGAEKHPSWITVRANTFRSTPGVRLFQSEVNHSSFIRVTIERCTRRRDLNHDWVHNAELVLKFDVSMAQWGAFVSSFGNGSGVPATLNFLLGEGQTPAFPFDSRLEESSKEVRAAVGEAVDAIAVAQAKVDEAFERGAGKKEMRGLLADVTRLVQQAPGNAVFAADSMAEYVEDVVTKAKADIEATVLHAIQAQGLEPGDITIPMLDIGGDVIDVN